MNAHFIHRIADRLIRYQEEYRRKRIPGPSYYAKMAERKRLAERVRALRGEGDLPIYDIETKLGQKDVARRAGVKTSEILQGPVDHVLEIDLAALPDKFVIKPIIGSGANGVFLLKKVQGKLVNCITNEIYEENTNSLFEAGLKNFVGCPLIAEELVELSDKPSTNWKIFAFYGEIGFIRQVELGEDIRGYKIWSASGTEIGPIDKHSFEYRADLPPPQNMQDLIEAAKLVSLNVRTPFVRVDLYELDKGVYLGEITLRPGSLWKSKYLHIFTPAWDRKLGIMWEEAQARIVEKIGEDYIL